MKKKILLLLLVLSPILAAEAQYFRFGGKAGGGVAGASGNDAPSDQINRYASIHVGLIAAYDFAAPITLHSELLYIKKGLTYSTYDVNPTEYYSGDLRLNYLELPLLVKYRAGGLFAEAGPYLGYLLSLNSDVSRYNSSSAGGATPQVIGPQNFNRNQFQAFDYGYAIGGGLAFENGFFMGLRHTGGLRSFSSEELNMRNSVWQISIGYLLPGVL
ncbi:PorT family protein [Pontibacter qinzhouensis]|uniref:PorT family protein n=1 Tax=Pontibacter qinzhouensis TaxID=2603253 RepID=A0A5C8JGY6_9BACT|nr:porin family protein [Pontibacter qinzhouensis]TXK36672.1 PorT family protein [Pontibacter qinzhouensis]